MINISLYYVNRIRVVDALPDIIAVIKAIPGSKLYYNGLCMVVSSRPNPSWIKLRIGAIQ